MDWPLPSTRRRADLAFVGAKLAIFVDGCFWHACPLHGTWPKANAVWWREKILGNVARDRDTDAKLKAVAWKVLRFSEHEHPVHAAAVVAATVRTRCSAGSRDLRFGIAGV